MTEENNNKYLAVSEYGSAVSSTPFQALNDLALFKDRKRPTKAQEGEVHSKIKLYSIGEDYDASQHATPRNSAGEICGVEVTSISHSKEPSTDLTHKERDLSKVQHILDLLTPSVRERVIKLANNPEHSHHIKYIVPNKFRELFLWTNTKENHTYWCNIDHAIENPEDRKYSRAFIQKEKEEIKERDLSKVQEILGLLVPEVREKVVKLANYTKGMYFHNYPSPSRFTDLFTWDDSPEKHNYWRDIDSAIRDPKLREDNPAFIKEFKWRMGVEPKPEDWDDDLIGVYQGQLESNYVKVHKSADYVASIMEDGVIWATISELKQFDSSNPAPTPFSKEDKS